MKDVFLCSPDINLYHELTVTENIRLVANIKKKKFRSNHNMLCDIEDEILPINEFIDQIREYYNPENKKINDLLEKVIPNIQSKLSIKMRIGLDNDDDIFNILPVLDNFPISEIIIHPRTGKQMYKGEVHTDVFENCLELTKHKISYNGDINTLEDFHNLKNRFKIVNSWMIGRGLVSNPFFAEQIKQNEKDSQENKISRFKEFHDALAKDYLDRLEGSSHFLNKMRIFWEYFSISFSNSHKVYKRIKKAT